MRLDLRPSKASELVPFQTCCMQALDRCEFTNTRCGVSEDGSLTWLYKGAVLEVVSTSTGHRIASLDAQHLLRDEQAAVVCVCEFRCQGRARLVVGINASLEQGMVVLLDVATSMVVKAVEIPQQVTAVEGVLTYGGSNVPSWALGEQLRHFYGIAAIGTEGGYVYLVDMALDWSESFDSCQRLRPCPLLLLDPRERDMDAARHQASMGGQHLAVRLGVDEQSHTNDCFHFRGPDLTVRQSFNEDEVQVSSLKYIPQSGSLAIGYSFGGFHLWKLFNPVIEFASTVEAEDLPVAFFVYQEPENDPKNFAYLWVARDDRLSDQKQESVCNVSLYQLSYSRRLFYANYGIFYEELNLLTLRLEHHLTVDPYSNRNTTTWSSQLLSASIITDHNYHPSSSLVINDSFDEGNQSPDLSLCTFVWEAQDSRPGNKTDVFMAVFDMNRWYHAQMPSRIKCVNVGGQEVCPYFAVYRMNDAVYKEGFDSLVDIQVKAGSLLRFFNNSPMPPEQHFYPSSLAFDTVCVMSNGLVSASALGVQRQVLASLESSGPSCLLKPFDLYHRCLQTALMARSSDPASVALSSEEQQRMSLLTLALEHGKIWFITACIRSWADGEFVQQGCTLQFLLSWAWNRVTAIKQQIDFTSQPLFDWSQAPVDQRMLQVLHNCLCGLAHLRTVLHTLLTQSSPLSHQSQVELEHRIRVVTLLHCHLKVILWFIHSGLLPEHEESSKLSPTDYIYPARELTHVFEDRRRQMRQSASGSDTHELILIDALVHSAGDSITQLWKNQDGSGMYPPPSLHAALSIYLLEEVEDRTKNAIMLYLLFDMAAVAHGQQEQFAEKIPRFARAFDLPVRLVQQIHGFWLIDHMNFEEGLNQLRLGSGQDLGPWQHACILHALMQQGESWSALRYLSMRNPPMLTAHHLKMRLSILIANRLVHQAVMCVRNSCGTVDQELMLKHIFAQCQQRKLMELLLKLPLTDKEEKCLQSYLSDNTDSASAELLVLHLLQRAQYVPAIRLNDRLKHRATMDMSSKARERSKTRNSIVDGFRHCLPATQQFLINNPLPHTKITHTHKIEVRRPKPLSTVVTQRAERRANSQSAMMLAVMDKVAEAGKLLAEEEGMDDGDRDEEVEVAPQSLMAHRKDLPSSDSEPVLINRPGPFLCTPSTPRLHTRLSVAGQVVFPAIKEMVKRLSSAALASPLSPSTNTTLRRSQVFTADCMSLLQTPKIDHTSAKVPSPVRGTTTTPHSILKVSRLPRSSPRALGVSRSPRGQPKRLGFSGSSIQSPPLPSTPTTLTPSSTPSPTSTTHPPSFKAVAVNKSVTEKSPVVTATPKQIRFAEPETREISPYVSPDNLARPPLHSPPEENKSPRQAEDSAQQERHAGETVPMSDEEITFNMSRQVAEPMDTDTESNSSTLPAITPSPAPDTTHFPLPSTPLSSQAPPPIQPEEENQESEAQSQLHPESRSRVSPPSIPAQSQLTSSSLPDSVAEKQSETNSTSSARDRSPLSARASVETETRSHRWRTSPQLSPRSLLRSEAAQQEVVTHTSMLRETKHHSFVSEERTGRYEVQIVSEESAKETTVVMEKALPQDALPIIECEHGSEVIIAHSVEAMETIEPAEDTILMEARQTSATHHKVVEEPQQSDTVEVAADEDVLDLEIKPPTPIRHSSRRTTPERSARSTHTSRRTKLKIDLAAITGQKEQEGAEPSPPKLRRISPGRERAPQEVDWSETMPPLRLEISDDENSNDNHTKSPSSSPSQMMSTSGSPQASLSQKPGRKSSKKSPLPSPSGTSAPKSSRVSPLFSPSRVSTRSIDRSPPVSPSRRLTRSIDGSPPVSPSRRSTRSVDRSPPVSPSRRSTRSVDRSPPVFPSRRSTRSVDRSPPASPSRRSTRSIDRSPPVSPSRRSTRSVDRSPPVSPSRRSTRSVDRSPPVSPSRRSTRSVDRSPPVSPSQRSTRSVDRSPPVSPSWRATHTIDRSPSPSRRTTQRKSEERGTTPERLRPAAKSTDAKEPLSVEVGSSSEELMPPPLSPARRSTRLRTPERSPGRTTRTPERSIRAQDTGVDSSKSEADGRQTPERSIRAQDTGVDSSKSEADGRQPPDSTTTTDAHASSKEEPIPRSPARRSRRSKTPDNTKVPLSQQDTPPTSDQPEDKVKSAGRRSTQSTKDSNTPKSPSRRSTRHSKTPDLVMPSEPVSPSRRSSRHIKASEKSDVASITSPSRWKTEDEGVSTSVHEESLEVAPPSGRASASLSRKGKRSTKPVASESAESASASVKLPSAGPIKSVPGDVSESAVWSESQQTSPGDLLESAVGSGSQQTSPSRPIVRSEELVSSPSRRSARSKSKTPERSASRVATRLRGKGNESVSQEIKDIATATEEVRSSRRQQKKVSPGAAGNVSTLAQETGDAPSFQFAPPMPLTRIHTEPTLAPPSDVAAFVFSPPITRATRSQRGSTSSAASADTSKSTRSRGRKESAVSVEEESGDTVPEVDQLASEDKAATTSKKKGAAKSRKKTKTRVVPSASPSNSPISIISPGQPTTDETSPKPEAKGAGRRSQPEGTRSHVLRKRKAKLW